ncbi:MAG: hypothetical protein ACFE78_06670 [Candidatus Hodarchaeota archaeon]
MSLSKTSNSQMKHRKNGLKKKEILGLFLIFICILNFFCIFNNFSYNKGSSLENDNKDQPITINSADIGYLFQDPFKKNFKKMWNFFRSNYESDLTLQIDTYYREGDSTGTILDDRVYPIDNLLLYKSLLKEDTSPSETHDNYLLLRESPLWYEGDINQHKYGFVKSVNSTTNKVYDYDRYLIDNLMPIFLLVENIGENTGDANYISSIEEAFALINSSEFRDTSSRAGFYHYNSTTDKYTESNLYAILANLEIHKLYEKNGLDQDIIDQAFELANNTMDKLLANVWDDTNGGFKYYSLQDWTTGSDYKYLSVNALGIITLIEIWKANGMKNDTIYLQYAELLFNKIEAMWDAGFEAYEYSRDGVWDISGAIRSIELESNSIMLTACMKLFETTRNLTYYNRAWQLHETFENSFYDDTVNAYKLSIDSPVNNNKNFYANLKLSEAYLYAAEIYASTVIKTSYNVSEEIPDYIFNEDTMNITSSYVFEKDIDFYNTTTYEYETYKSQYNIVSADITYLFKYPNGTFIEKRQQQIIDESITLLYNINDSMPIGSGYYLYIYTNTSIFATAISLKRYNIISGLRYEGILGLPNRVYQGPTYNITLQINNTRNEDVTLNVSMEGDDIYNHSQVVYLPTMVLTNISFSLIAVLEADLGDHNLTFQFKKNEILYLEIIRIIDIGHSFDYADFYYESRVTSGGIIDISLKLLNFLPNSSQYLNITFSGEDLAQEIVEEITLLKSETKTVYYSIELVDNITSDTTEIEMNIKKGNTVFYTKSFSIKIIKKFELLSVTFPNVVPQGDYAYFIMVIQNNQKISEMFSLYVNEERVETNINGLGPGKNTIIAKVLPTINPYDFQTKSYAFVLRDSSNDIIAQFYFEVKVELTTFNFVVFYLLPILIPIAIVLFYKNKEIKHKLLRR